jgi:hypothetical protein
MRKVVLGLLSLGMATVAIARQRGAVTPAVSTPAIHVTPVGVSHDVQPHVSTHGRAEAHGVTPGIRPVLPHKPVVHPLPLPPRLSTGSNLPPASGGFPVTGLVLSFFGGAFYVPVASDGESTPQEEAQENDSNQQPESSREANDQEPSASAPSPTNPDSDSPEEPLAEFVFVKRDGSTLFAVAYTMWNDKVQYVTKEGLRRTVALDSLDLDATQKLNEERGNTINLRSLSRPA